MNIFQYIRIFLLLNLIAPMIEKIPRWIYDCQVYEENPVFGQRLDHVDSVFRCGFVYRNY